MTAIITEDWTLYDVRNELLSAKKENRVPVFTKSHIWYNVKTNPTLIEIEKFISMVGKDGYNVKLKDVNILYKRRYKMTQEQKAQAYDGALERMKSWVRGEHPECFTEAQKAAEFIFPELKESEGEGIRKELTEFLRKASGGFLDTVTPCKTYSKWLAWLEKQGEKVVDENDRQMMNQLHSWMKEFGGAEEYTEKVYRWIKGLLEKLS